ncbi:hypothetical protein AB4349_17490, partial [Vibrio breoganii]
ILYYSINSNRNSIFLLLINLMAVYFSIFNGSRTKLQKKEIKRLLTICTLSLVFLFGFFQLGQIRHSVKKSVSHSSYGLVNALNGAFGNHENIVWLLDNNFDKQYGYTYLSGITNFIPRSIWPEKPLGAGPILKNEIYPGSYIIGQRGNSSLTTGLYTEVVMNFGFIISNVAIILIAGLISVFLSKLKMFEYGIGRLIVVFSIVVFSSQFLYAEFLGFFVRYIFSVIPLFFCYFLQFGGRINETDITRHG